MMNKDVYTEVREKVLNHNGIERSFITLAYAQTLDGIISILPSLPVNLSNVKTEIFTHRLCALHDAIFIGIGTLVADDPLPSIPSYISIRNTIPAII